MVIVNAISSFLCAQSMLNNNYGLLSSSNTSLFLELQDLGGCLPHLDSAVRYNRPTEINMYIQHPISRAAKDITA